MHPQQPKFKLNRNVILAGLISASFPITGYCIPAGRVDFVVGNVEAVALNGARRPLSKGSEISPGDAIHTAAGARAQVRFVDGGYVSLQPNTQFRVDEFNYKNKTDGEEKGFFSLLKGGLRAITGAIGHSNRDAYQVKTPSATIGIRGTGYRAEVKDNGLLISVGEGAVFLTNNMGAVLVTAGNGAYVANINTAPTATTEQPNTPPASITQIPTTSSTSSSTVPPTAALPSLKSGNNYAVIGAYTLSPTTNGKDALASPAEAIFNENRQLVKVYDPSSTSGRSIGSATVTFAATDGIIGWGRWDGTSSSTNGANTYDVSGVYHYVAGIPTVVMPTTGSATYTMIGYTNPSPSTSTTGYTVKADLTANFGVDVKLSMRVENATSSFNFSNATLTLSGSTFSNTFISTTDSKGTACAGSGCSTNVAGFFVGDNAARAGLAYSVVDGSSQDILQGTAVFAKN